MNETKYEPFDVEAYDLHWAIRGHLPCQQHISLSLYRGVLWASIRACTANPALSPRFVAREVRQRLGLPDKPRLTPLFFVRHVLPHLSVSGGYGISRCRGLIRELARNEGRPGEDLVVTLDLGLQGYVSRRLAGQSAAVVVLDVHTGDVLALASSPSYDPNAFAQGLSRAAWQELVNDPLKPLVDKATAGRYPPGSTFKMIGALAALEAGVVTPEHRVWCTGMVRFGDRDFHCWKRSGHGEMQMIRAIEESCDVYFYDVARRVGIDRIAAMSRRFGFGEPSGIDLPGADPGLVPDRAWKLAKIGTPWQQGETLIVGIGQGYLLATPLQLAVMTARLANGGIAVRPRLSLRGAKVAEEPRFEDMGVSPESLAVVVEGMNRSTNSRRGTSYRARISDPDMAMAGKTGTSQVRRITERERASRKNRQTPWRERDHALYVAFAPLHAPRYAIAVVVEHGGSGARTAAPIARDILWEAQRRDPARMSTPGLDTSGGKEKV